MLYSRSSNRHYIPHPPPTTPETLERPKTCMIVTTREGRIEQALQRAKTPISPRRRHVFTNESRADDLQVLTREYPPKYRPDAMLDTHKGCDSNDNEQISDGAKSVQASKPIVKERVPTPWKPLTTEPTRKSNSSDEAENTVVSNGSNLQKEPSVVSTHHVIREYSFRRSSHGSTNEILVTSEQEFHVTQQPEYSNESVYSGQRSPNVSTQNTEGHDVYMTSDIHRHSFNGVEALTCCQGQNNNRFNINTKHKARDPFHNGAGIVREKTIIATTISAPRTPLRRVKLDLDSDGSNIAIQYPLIGDDFTNYPQELILSDDDYWDSVSADDEDTISDGDPEISSLTYPSSAGSVQDNLEQNDTLRRIFSTPSRLLRNIKDFFKRNTKEEQRSRSATVGYSVQKSDNYPPTEYNLHPGLIRENTRMYPFRSSTFPDKNTPAQPIELARKQDDMATNIEEEIVGSLPKEASQDDGILSVADTISQEGRSSAATPCLESAPPSALKKRGSASRSGSVKKQKVQFDMDVEVHLVPRDAYQASETRQNVDDPFESIYDGAQLEDDQSVQVSNDLVDDEEDIQTREINQFDNAGKIRQHGPSVPFRVIKREMPTGGSRRGRRNSYDLIQKSLTRQFRNQHISDNGRRSPRQVVTKRAPLSPPRTPHTSYYHSRENRRMEDARMQARANAMSPDHYMAFYTKQQQIKQYLDHERRLRRQQLFNGNVKYQERQRKIERANERLGGRDDDSDSDSGASMTERLPRVQSHVHDPPLPQPRPYVMREPAGGRRRFLTEDERSRISSGYGGSASEMDGASLPSMATNQSLGQPFTQRQVAEVMRAAGLNKGRSPYLEEHGNYEEYRHMPPSRQRKKRHDKAASEGGSYSRLSHKAKQALQQAHQAYSSSVNEMMPVAKGLPSASDPKEQSRLMTSQSYPTDDPSRYLSGHARVQMPEMPMRHKYNAGAGNRIGSAHTLPPSSTYAGPYPIPAGVNRPGTSEGIFVNMLGLSAKLPLNARRSAHRQRSHPGYNLSQPIIQQNSRNSGEPYRRMTSGNKSPYLKSQLPDDWTRRLRQSLSDYDSSKNRPFFNHAPSNISRGRTRNSDMRSGHPQLRRNGTTFAVSEGSHYDRRLASKMMA